MFGRIFLIQYTKGQYLEGSGAELTVRLPYPISMDNIQMEKSRSKQHDWTMH